MARQGFAKRRRVLACAHPVYVSGRHTGSASGLANAQLSQRTLEGGGDGAAGSLVELQAMGLGRPLHLPSPCRHPPRHNRRPVLCSLQTTPRATLLPPARRCCYCSLLLLLPPDATARLWGYSSLYLHVKRENGNALELYRSMGYRPVSEQGAMALLPGALNQLLLAKELLPLQLGGGSSSSSSTVAAIGSAKVPMDDDPGQGLQAAGPAQRKDKVFVWSAAALPMGNGSSNERASGADVGQ